MVKNAVVNAGLGRAAGMMVNEDGTLHPKAEGGVRRLLSVQRPIVLAYLRSLRRRHPEATPADIAEIVRSHYVNLTTGGGAAVGATAVVPGIGTGAAMGVAAVETAGFLEGSALYAQAVAELHGLPVRDPERANVLVMGLMLGESGRELVKKFAGQASGTGPAVTANWGQMVTKQLPASMMNSLTRRMRKMLLKKYAAKASGSFVGRILPFGVGAVVGAVVNRTMANTVVDHARTAFGPFPVNFVRELDPQVSTPRRDANIVGGLKNVLRLKKKRAGEVIDGEVVDEQEAERGRKGRKGRGFGRKGDAGRKGSDGRGGPDIVAHTGSADPDTADEAPRTYHPDVRL